MTNHLHGLKLDTGCHSTLNYGQISNFLKTFILDNTNNEHDEICVAFERSEKKEWLGQILFETQILDLDEEACLRLEDLKKIFKSHHCQQHL